MRLSFLLFLLFCDKAFFTLVVGDEGKGGQLHLVQIGDAKHILQTGGKRNDRQSEQEYDPRENYHHFAIALTRHRDHDYEIITEDEPNNADTNDKKSEPGRLLSVQDQRPREDPMWKEGDTFIIEARPPEGLTPEQTDHTEESTTSPPEGTSSTSDRFNQHTGDFGEKEINLI